MSWWPGCFSSTLWVPEPCGQYKFEASASPPRRLLPDFEEPLLPNPLASNLDAGSYPAKAKTISGLSLAITASQEARISHSTFASWALSEL